MPSRRLEGRGGLPSAVHDLAKRLGVRPNTERSTVALTQAGRMKKKLGIESWMSFTAKQKVNFDAVGKAFR